eukprot:gnl/Dysnectes_brevis/1269_a1423_2475.p1 GENE.gnl/Dysnectes_brevis/1269_a1423_2475~~gnl/Dysnectes_brevis/1269_a1423_2475.p1  ORF type:complete len:572 (+),score=185.46 gnl/Dysnectes_brevis/1269_a1423_2475:24-1718(+)
MSEHSSSSSEAEETNTWESLKLDPRICAGLKEMELFSPLPIQMETIPAILEGKDVLIHAYTGSGKTLAFVLPILHRCILKYSTHTKEDEGAKPLPSPLALILVPTKELCLQISEVVTSVVHSIGSEALRIKCVGTTSVKEAGPLLKSFPQILVATPKTVGDLVTAGRLSLGRAHTLVMDEADLLLSFNYQGDLDMIRASLPAGTHKVLSSATLGDPVKQLGKLVLRKGHRLLDLRAQEQQLRNVPVQHAIKLGLEPTFERYLVLFGLMKLRLVQGRVVIFTNKTDTAYSVLIFLYRFGIRAGVYDPALPIKARERVLARFNAGETDVLVAADHSGSELMATEDTDKEAGVFRGLDFSLVSAVVNFDMPLNTTVYTHRVGRTARGKAGRGHGLSIVDPSHTREEQVFEMIREEQRETMGKPELEWFDFNLDMLSSFRYRVRDVLTGITRHSVRQFRAHMVKGEMLLSDSLKDHFSVHEGDLKMLKTELTNPVVEQQRRRTLHLMKALPAYLVPGQQIEVAALSRSSAVKGIRTRKQRQRDRRRAKVLGNKRGKNPLKSVRVKKRR